MFLLDCQSQNHLACPQTQRTEISGEQNVLIQIFNKHHPIPQEIREHAKYEACQPEAVILNLACTLESPGKL